MVCFSGGVPTTIEVNKLLEHYGRPTIGQRMSYDDVAEVVRLDKKSGRFRTVTNSWRSAIYKTYNLVVACEPGDGFVVIDDAARVDLGATWHKGAMRKIRRVKAVVSATSEEMLTDEQRERRRHLDGVSASLIMHERREARKLPAPKISDTVGQE